MTPFLFETASFIHQNYADETRELLVVLPNRRGALFLKRHLAKIYNKTIWVPRIISAEEFIEELSGLQTTDSITLVSALYDSYATIMKEKAESFDNFIKWANMLLQDYNEIDRYLVDAAGIYRNLAEIKEIENWSLAEEIKTEMQSNYIAFMSALGSIYEDFVKRLETNGMAYQGLAYKHAVKNIKENKVKVDSKYILFAGFNALNRAEEVIFSYFIKEHGASVLWDADHYYLDDVRNEAGLFLRKHLSNELFRGAGFFGKNLLEGEKNISIIGAPKNMAQVAVASSVLKDWYNKGFDASNTAVVLCDESLLFPLLSTLPEEAYNINVSLEYPLSQSILFDLAEQLLNLHINKKGSSIYYKDLLKVLQNPYFNILMGGGSGVADVIKRMSESNITYFSVTTLKKLFDKHYARIAFLLEGWANASEAVSGLLDLSDKMLLTLEERVSKTTALELEFAFEFKKLIARLQEVSMQVNYITELKTLRKIMQQLVSGSSVPFLGEPLKGLQIMGVLETRTLDFENIILISVNENILPSGKSANTFIPFDLKRYFKLPVYQDKDAIYAYHFYRLLQRAKNVALIYNTEADTFGKGEKSRFITQMEHEMPVRNPNAKLSASIAVVTNEKREHKQGITIEKSEGLIQKIKEKAYTEGRSGFSPSLLNTYRDCSLRFYFNYLANIRETEEVEEELEANTFGRILHKVLEESYKPFRDKYLTEDDFKLLKAGVESLTEQAFQEEYKEADYKTGKNFLAFQTIITYANNLLREDEQMLQERVKSKDSLMIVDLERKLEHIIEIKYKNEIVPVKISGTVDRIDRSANNLRVVDYKSSVKDSDKFDFTGFDELFNNSDYNKAFQLFIYTWLAWKNNVSEASAIKACIIPFRSKKKNEYYITQGKGDFVFSNAVLEEFEVQLVALICRMLDENNSFEQTPDEDKCTYCAYNAICSRA